MDIRRPTIAQVVAFATAATLVLLLGAAAPATARQNDLAEVRQATARYHDLDAAIADGYELGYGGIITHCVAHPTFGAMGYHYFNAELMESADVDPTRPEGLVYAPGPNGQLRLVAVEWVVPPDVWAASGNDGEPSVLGMDLHVLNPDLGWYIHHAWVWMPNPSGMEADWNPRVDCDEQGGRP